jgi:hypothetical protein
MSFLKATWWRPASALLVLALAVLALSLSGTGTAQAGDPATVTIDPAQKDIGVGGEGDVAIKINPPASGTSIWIIQVKFDPAVAKVKLDAQQNPVCTPMGPPGQGIAQAAGCDIKASGDHGTEDDTAVAFGGWVQNDNGTPRGFTTEQTAATFTFVATGAAATFTDLTTTVTSMLGPNGEVATPTASNGRIDITAASGTNRVFGDGDCNGAIAPRDSQAGLKVFLSQTPLSQTPPCPALGSNVTFNGFAVVWGDWDCNGALAPRDSQADLKVFLSQTPLSQGVGCPVIGATGSVSP